MKPGLTSRPRVVVIGAGFAGLQVVKRLKHAPVDILVIDRRNYHLFQPLLYQVATAALTPSEIAYPIRSIFKRQQNARVIMDEVVSIELGSRRLVLKHGGQTGYDFLVVAAGAVDSYFGHKSWQQYALGLKSLEDAIEIRRQLLLAFEEAERAVLVNSDSSSTTIVLIGAGPTGVELAGAIAELTYGAAAKEFRFIDLRKHVKIVLVEAAERVLPQMDPSLSTWAKNALNKLGVEIRTGVAVTGIEEGRVYLGGEIIHARLIIWTAGIAGAPLLQKLGISLAKGNRVVVNDDLSLPGHPEVFVIGDAALVLGRDSRPVPAVAPAAIQQGRHVAANILRTLSGRPCQAFKYTDKGSLVVLGRGKAIAELGRFKFKGFFAWILWVIVHIAYLVGFRNRLLVLTEWSWAYFTRQSGSRLITEYGSRDLQLKAP